MYGCITVYLMSLLLVNLYVVSQFVCVFFLLQAMFQWFLFSVHFAPIYTMYLPQSSPQGDNTDQMLCTFNILVLVNKLLFLKSLPIHLFLSLFLPSPKTGLAASSVLPPWSQEHLTPQDSFSHVNHPVQWLPTVHRISPNSSCWQSTPSMIGPQSSFPDSFLTLTLSFWLFSEYIALFFLCIEYPSPSNLFRARSAEFLCPPNDTHCNSFPSIHHGLGWFVWISNVSPPLDYIYLEIKDSLHDLIYSPIHMALTPKFIYLPSWSLPKLQLAFQLSALYPLVHY